MYVGCAGNQEELLSAEDWEALHAVVVASHMARNNSMMGE
jgi:hypothetical protein